MSATNIVSWNQGHLDALASAQLPRGRGGYRPEDVDRWLDHAAALMRTEQRVEPPGAGTFRKVRLGEGYDVLHVDALVVAVARWQQEVLETDRLAAQPPPPEPVRRRSAVVRLNWTVQQRDWVRETEFPTRSGKWAYEMDEVDSFLDEVLTAMTKGESLPAIERARFTLCRRLGRGYDAPAVDDFLEQITRLRPAT